MNGDGNARTSTLIIGALGTLAIGAAGTLIAKAVAPRLVYWSAFPAVIFMALFVLAHQRRRGGRRP